MAMPMVTSTSDEELLSNFHQLHLDRWTAKEDAAPVDNNPSLSNAGTTEVNDRSDWVSAIRHSEYTTNRHRRHSHYPFETKKLLHSLQQSSTNRCTKAKARSEERKSSSSSGTTTTFTLQPSKLTLKKTSVSSAVSTSMGRRVRKEIRKRCLDTIPEESSTSAAAATTATSSEPTVPPLQQSCSQQATSGSELNINELASYFDLYCEIPRKMSPMAEMMYT